MFPEHVATPRLLGTRISEADEPLLRIMHQDADVMRTLGGIRNAAETRRLLDRFLADWSEDGFGLWWWRDRVTGASAGHGGLRRTRVDGADEVEVAYVLLPAFWGQGHATEIAQLSVDLAFGELKLRSVVAFTLTTNRASRRVMEKAGFRFEKAVTHAGLPHVLYRRYAPADDSRL